MCRPPRCVFRWGDFGSKLNTATEDTAIVDVQIERWTFEIVSRIGFPGVRCEGASVLRLWVVRKGVVEVIVALWIRSESLVVGQWREIDGGSCPRQHESALDTEKVVSVGYC